MVPIKDALRKIGSAGALLPSSEARLIGDDGNDVEPGKGIPGEIWLREYSLTYVHCAFANHTFCYPCVRDQVARKL